MYTEKKHFVIVKLNLKSRNSKSGFESSFLGCTEWVLQLDITKKKMSQTCGRLVINNPYTNISIAEQESFKHFFCRLRLTVNKNIFFFKGVRGYVDINLIF